MQLNRPFAKNTADTDPGMQEIRPLVYIRFTGGMYPYRLAGLRKKFVVIEIAETPDEV
jgi:hypothetical protein